VDDVLRLVIQSELVANEPAPKRASDPRGAAALEQPLLALERDIYDYGGTLLHSTRHSGLMMAAGMYHEADAPSPVAVDTNATDDWARTTFVCTLQPGQRLRIVKLLAYGWSRLRSEAALRDQVAAALTRARHTGFEGLRREQKSYLDDYWDGADVRVDGDPRLQQAVRFALFHVLQTGARAERRCLPAKGLTGPGYDGHAFWDSEAYLLPVLVYLLPDAVADALRWRHSTLGLARERATTLGLRGAVFPWRTIHGQECSGYWPAGTAAFHVNADIALAVLMYRSVTGDESLETEGGGLELLV
jgi:trehalose/maltose hydrolase-like predicted phosphorylase